MPKEKAGELFLMILGYVNDEDPETEDLLVDVVFEPIKQQLKRDLIQWEAQIEARSANGRRGGIKSGETRRSKTKQPFDNRSTPSKNEANEAVNVNVTVNDNVNDNVIKDNTGNIDMIVRRGKFVKPTEAEITDYLTKEKNFDEFSAMGFAAKFCNYYESNGWKVGKNPMKSWKGAVGTWLQNEKNNPNATNQRNHEQTLGRRSAGFGVIADMLREING